MAYIYGYNYQQKVQKRVNIDNNGVLYVDINDPITSFGDLRTTELTPEVSVNFLYNYVNDEIITNEVTNGGSFFVENNMGVINTGVSFNGEAYFESKNIIKYRSGLGALGRFSCLFDNTNNTGSCEQLAGIGDEENGYFFGYNDDSFGIMRLDNGTSFWIPQNSWNVDTYDGNGITTGKNPSNIKLLTDKLNIYQIGYQWLGAGEINFYIENPSTGMFNLVHKIKYPNTNVIPSLKNPDLPLTARVKNTGNNSNVTVKISSMGGFIEGKKIIYGPIKSYSSDVAVNADVENHIFSLRNNVVFNSFKNKIKVYLRIFSASNDADGLTNFYIYKNISLTLGSGSWTDISNSVMQYGDINSFSTDSSKIIYMSTTSSKSGKTDNLTDFNLSLSPGDTITVVGKPKDNGNITAVLVWLEDF